MSKITRLTSPLRKGARTAQALALTVGVTALSAHPALAFEAGFVAKLGAACGKLIIIGRCMVGLAIIWGIIKAMSNQPGSFKPIIVAGAVGVALASISPILEFFIGAGQFRIN